VKQEPVATAITRSIKSAEIVTVGTELLLGEIVDTNGAWLAADLADRGVDVYWSVRVGDNLQRLCDALRHALERADLVVTCGGLGPTDDDLTREAIAAVLGRTPQVNAELERELRDWFSRSKRHMPERNLKQAWLIEDAEALPNPVGTAPGWLATTAGKVIVALPGPPAEMTRMWREQAVTRLQFPTTVLYRHTIKTFGIGESAVVEVVGNDWFQSAQPSVATYAKRDGVHVRIAAKATTREEAEGIASNAIAHVRTRLQQYVWGTDGDTLPAVIGAQLRARGWSLGTVESLTAGLACAEMATVPGISDVLRGAVVAYWPEVKRRLGVPADIIEQHGVVSGQTAEAMAVAGCRFLGADVCVSTTGVAGPTSMEGKPVGEVWIGVSGPWGSSSTSFQLGDRGREVVRERAAMHALATLWKALPSQARPSP
jgi:nicotinamide-nucleotide amidase